MLALDGMVEVVVQWVRTGAVWPLIGLWVALVVGDMGVAALISRVFGRGVLARQPPSGGWVMKRVGVDAAVTALAVWLPAVEEFDGALRVVVQTDEASSWLQVGLLGGVLAVAEELVFRGLPVAAASILGLSTPNTVVLVAAGTLLWAAYHGLRHGVRMLLWGGWLLAALWLAGHGLLAVGLAVASALFMLGSRTFLQPVPAVEAAAIEAT